MESIGDRIRVKRKELGFTQMDLAERLHVTDRAVSKWELNDGNPDFSLLPVLSEVLGVSLDYLITGNVEEPQVNLDDMDTIKRAVYLTVNDDVENFIKFGYVSGTVLFDYYHNPQKDKTLEENIRAAIYERKSAKIFNEVLNAFLKDGIKNYRSLYQFNPSPASLVYDDINNFISMCAVCGRRDALEVLGVKWFSIGDPETRYDPNCTNYRPIQHPFQNCDTIYESKSTYHISREAFESCFAEDVSDEVVDYFCDLMIYDRSNSNDWRRPRVMFLLNDIVSALYKYKHYNRLEHVLLQLTDNLNVCAREREKDYGQVRLSEDTFLISENYYNRGQLCGVIPTLSYSVVAEANDIYWLRQFNEYNKLKSLLFGDGKSGYLTEEDIQALIIRNDKSVPEDEKIKVEFTRYRLLQYRAVPLPQIQEVEDVEELKKAISRAQHVYDKIISNGFIHYMELIETYLIAGEYRKIFEFACDYELTELEDAALEMNNEHIIAEAKTLFLPHESYTAHIIKHAQSLQQLYNVSETKKGETKKGETKKGEKKNGYSVTRTVYVIGEYTNRVAECEKALNDAEQHYLRSKKEANPLLYDLLCRQHAVIPIHEYCQVTGSFIDYCKDLKRTRFLDLKQAAEEKIESITQENALRAEYEKVTSELTNEYLSDLLSRDETELFIIRLCSLFDIVLKYVFRIQGEDLHSRMKAYFDNGPKSREVDDGWGYMELDTEWENNEVKPWNARRDLFHRLRMQRNNIAHSENTQVQELTPTELRDCLTYVMSLVKKEE